MTEHDAPAPAARLDLSRFVLTREQFDDAFLDTYERDLFPYADDEFLANRLYEDNRTLRQNPNLQEDVQIALIADDDETILEVVDTITTAWQHTRQANKPINSALSFLTLAGDISDYKVALLGQDAPVVRVNAIINLIGQNIAHSVPEDQLSDALYSARYLQQRLDTLDRATQGDRFFFYNVKLKSFLEVIQRRDLASRYIEALPGDDPEPVSEEALQNDSEYIKNVFEDIQKTRRWGVKMAYTPDVRGGSLVFSPPVDIHDFFGDQAVTAHELTTASNAVTDIIHSRLTHPKRIKLEAVGHTRPGGEKIEVGSLSAQALEPLGVIQLGPDGELYVDRQCTVSYAEIARQKGKYRAYREIQATILAHYFDLTHPAEEIPKTESPTLHSPSFAITDRDPLESIERLVVPRMRKALATLGPKNVETEQPKRSIRQHQVTWHVRTLPPGWGPSPAALELAEQLGVELEPDETIVKAHNRGKKALGEVVGHKMVKLNVSR